MAITSINASTAPATAAPSTAVSTDPAEAQDRFLKLLVAQLNNQDPMNPVDNAQMTSQIAQINTVSGIQQLNQTLTSMAAQFTSLQVLQGTSMVGHDVLVQSSTLNVDAGVAKGAIDLDGNADSVKIDVLDPYGHVIDSMDLGPQRAGRQMFQWDASNYQGSSAPSIRVTASQGSQAISATSMAQAKVLSVGSASGAMSVQLQGLNAVPYSAVKAIL